RVRLRDRVAHHRRQRARRWSLVPVLAILVVGVLVVVFQAVLRLVLVTVLVVALLFVVAVELERVEHGYAESTAARLAVPRIANLHLLEIVVLDFQLGVTFRAGRHTFSLRCETVPDGRSARAGFSRGRL